MAPRTLGTPRTPRAPRALGTPSTLPTPKSAGVKIASSKAVVIPEIPSDIRLFGVNWLDLTDENKDYRDHVMNTEEEVKFFDNFSPFAIDYENRTDLKIVELYNKGKHETDQLKKPRRSRLYAAKDSDVSKYNKKIRELQDEEDYTHINKICKSLISHFKVIDKVECDVSAIRNIFDIIEKKIVKMKVSSLDDFKKIVVKDFVTSDDEKKQVSLIWNFVLRKIVKQKVDPAFLKANFLLQLSFLREVVVSLGTSGLASQRPHYCSGRSPSKANDNIFSGKTYLVKDAISKVSGAFRSKARPEL